MVKSNGRVQTVALVATHPIQYQIPWYRALAKRNDLRLRVYFMFVPDAIQQGEGFEHGFSWDTPLLDGYSWSRLDTRNEDKSTARFYGLRTKGVSKLLIRDEIDICIIHGWGSYGLLQALFACKKLGITTLIRGEANSHRPRPWWKNAGHRLLLRQFDACLGIGRANVDFYVRHGFDEKRIFWCPYCVDNDRFHENAQRLKARREIIRRRWDISKDDICFLFAGKFQQKKRIPDLMHALHLARRQNRKIRLLAVGSGEEEENARRLSRELSVPITFAGFLNQSKISEAYVAADCLVLPSDHDETWGLVVNEAMASGIPAIVSDRVGCRSDLIIPDETGAVFRFGDVSGLSEALLTIAADRDRRVYLGKRAHEHIQAYGIERAAAGLVQALRYLRPYNSKRRRRTIRR